MKVVSGHDLYENSSINFSKDDELTPLFAHLRKTAELTIDRNSDPHGSIAGWIELESHSAVSKFCKAFGAFYKINPSQVKRAYLLQQAFADIIENHYIQKAFNDIRLDDIVFKIWCRPRITQTEFDRNMKVYGDFNIRALMYVLGIDDQVPGFRMGSKSKLVPFTTTKRSQNARTTRPHRSAPTSLPSVETTNKNTTKTPRRRRRLTVVDPNVGSAQVKKAKDSIENLLLKNADGNFATDMISHAYIPKSQKIELDNKWYDRRSLREWTVTHGNKTVPHTRRELTKKELERIARGDDATPEKMKKNSTRPDTTVATTVTRPAWR